MSAVTILAPVVNKSITAFVLAGKYSPAGRAVLLGTSGEQLKVYTLTGDRNDLSLDGFAAGPYALRVEAGNEVVVRQIIIPSSIEQ